MLVSLLLSMHLNEEQVDELKQIIFSTLKLLDFTKSPVASSLFTSIWSKFDAWKVVYPVIYLRWNQTSGLCISSLFEVLLSLGARMMTMLDEDTRIRINRLSMFFTRLSAEPSFEQFFTDLREHLSISIMFAGSCLVVPSYWNGINEQVLILTSQSMPSIQDGQLSFQSLDNLFPKLF